MLTISLAYYWPSFIKVGIIQYTVIFPKIKASKDRGVFQHYTWAHCIYQNFKKQNYIRVVISE